MTPNESISHCAILVNFVKWVYHIFMKIPFKQTFSTNTEVLLRRIGYARQEDKKLEKISYFRRLGVEHFPKFHVYITSEDPLEVDLHLDHKSHAYEGQRAHGGDYEGPLVRTEALRIWNGIRSQESGVGSRSKVETQESEGEEKKGFFARLFGE